MNPNKRWVVTFLLSGVSLLLIVLAISYIMDPFELRKDHKLHFSRELVNRKENVALWALCETKHLAPETIRDTQILILGDSRARLLTNHFPNHRFGEFDDKKVYNLCIGGCSLEESIALFKREEERAKQFKNLETVVITTPLMRFCEPDRPNRVNQSGRLVDFPLRYYLNDLVVRRSLVSLGKLGLEGEDGPKAGEEQAVMTAWLKNYRGYTPEKFTERVEVVSQFTTKMKKKGVRVVMYLPPGAGGRENIITKLGMAELKRGLVKALDEMGEFHDLANWTQIDGVEFGYLPGDPIHHDHGGLVLQYLLKSSF